MANPNDWQDVDDWQDAPTPGEPGSPGVNQYDPKTPPMTAGGAHLGPARPKGTALDAVKSWANRAVQGAGPQIEGAMGAYMQDAKNLVEGEPFHPKISPMDAYRGVRDLGEEEHRKSEDTDMGAIGGAIGSFSTPVPVKGLGPGASVGAKAWQGAKVGGAVGALGGAATSKGDLTKLDSENWKRVIADALVGGAGGVVGGATVGGAMGAIEKPARSVARQLPMDMLGVSEPARRSMQRQGIYDEAGDSLLELVRPFRSGMRKGSLTEDAVAELGKRGQRLESAESALDAAAPGGVVTTGGMADAVRARAKPFEAGNLQDKQVASRMNKEASNLLDTLGSTDPEIGARIPLAEAEAFKQRFGPGVAKLLRHAGEPAAKTTALGETYRALKGANEAAAADVSPKLAAAFKKAKRDYSQLAAPLEGASVERSGMRGSDFDLGEALSSGPAPTSFLGKLGELPGAGLVKVPLDLAGRAYGRGVGANIAEFLANRMARNTGGAVGGVGGGAIASKVARSDALAPYLRLLEETDR